MVDLGLGIRKALARLTGATLVDEGAIRELIKDLQRVLIANDVSVKLVFELTKKIEKRCLEEKPLTGFSLREHVVRVVYDELVGVLGEKYEPKLAKQRILMLGLYGQGKCVHPSTLVPLPSGEVKTIREVYDSAAAPERALPGGFVKEGVSVDVFAVDPDTLKMGVAKSGTLWKLRKTEPLYRVRVDNGGSECVTTTPEHPFLSLRDGALSWKRADRLRMGDLVAMPRSLPFPESEWVLPVLEHLPAAARLIDAATAARLRTFLVERFGTLEKAHADLESPRPYCGISAELKRGEVCADLLRRAIRLGFEYSRPEEYRIASGHRPVCIPSRLTPDLAEFMGYVYGDGNLQPGIIHITNKEDAVVERMLELSQRLFGVLPTVLALKRSDVNIRRVSLCSKAIIPVIANAFGLPTAAKSRVMSLPSFFLTSPKEATTRFLQAYFDCDGHVAEGQRHLEMVTASTRFAGQLRALLLKQGIQSSYAVKHINGWVYHRVCVAGRSAEVFAREIGSNVPHKRERLSQLARIGAGQRAGKLENLHVGTALLRQVREYKGATVGELQRHVSSYGIHKQEGVISRESLLKLLDAFSKTKNLNNALLETCFRPTTNHDLRERFGSAGWLNACLGRLDALGLVNQESGVVQTTDAGRLLLERNGRFDPRKIDFLRQLAEADLVWSRVVAIELDESTEFVYDLTVEGHHNFVANNFIVHNTTTIGKLARFYQSKGLKVAVIAGDVHRPAAFEQLQQLAEAAHCGFWGKKGERDAARIAKLAREEMENKFDVLIFDSAGRSAFDEELVAELKAVNDAFDPQERFLVVSADLGQVAGRQAAQFHEAVGLTGVIVTKMDGSGKGGGALSSVSTTGARVAFIGTGEKLEQLEVFDSKRFVAQLCGFPDLGGLLEKTHAVAEEEALQKALEEGELNYESFLAQMRAMKKMGPLKGILQMMGAYDLPEELVGKSEERLKKFEAAVHSMTPRERQQPELMRQRGRQERVAKGSGMKPEEVRELVSSFDKAQGMLKGMRKNRGLMKRLGGMMKGGALKLPGM